jgi:hypothetical protein
LWTRFLMSCIVEFWLLLQSLTTCVKRVSYLVRDSMLPIIFLTFSLTHFLWENSQ